MKNRYLVFICLLLLVGCSPFAPVKRTPVSSYVIDIVPPAKRYRKKTKHRVTLLVATPEAAAAYQSKQMAYSTQPYKLSYFSQNQWAELPTQMLAPLMVQTLQDTGVFKAVINPPYSGRYDYVLSSQLLMLEQDYIHHPGTLRFVFRAQLLKASNRKLVAAHEWVINEKIHEAKPYAGVIATNQAVGKMLVRMRSFVLRYIN